MANGRIRTVKPEFFRSPDTASVSPRARLLYIALWCWADDYGIGETNLNGLLGFAFPDDDQMERKELQSLCKEVADGYKVLFYEVRGRHFYAIPSWDDHQKTQRRASCRNPKPDDPDSVPDLRFCNDLESSVSSQGSSLQLQGETPSGTGEQGNRGTGEQGKKESVSPPVKAPPKPKGQTQEHVATDSAYSRTGKAFNFMGVRGIAKWAIHDKGYTPQVVEDAIVSVHEMGKPITKQTLDQFINGALTNSQSGSRDVTGGW